MDFSAPCPYAQHRCRDGNLGDSETKAFSAQAAFTFFSKIPEPQQRPTPFAS